FRRVLFRSIGFILIFGILVYMMYMNKPTEEEVAAQEKAKQEQVEAEKKAIEKTDTAVTTATDFSAATITDSTQLVALNNKLGAFAYSSTLPSATNKETFVETEVLEIGRAHV